MATIVGYKTREGREVLVTMTAKGKVFRIVESDAKGVMREMKACKHPTEVLKFAPPRQREFVSRALIRRYVLACGGKA